MLMSYFKLKSTIKKSTQVIQKHKNNERSSTFVSLKPKSGQQMEHLINRPK